MKNYLVWLCRRRSKVEGRDSFSVNVFSIIKPFRRKRVPTLSPESRFELTNSHIRRGFQQRRLVSFSVLIASVVMAGCQRATPPPEVDLSSLVTIGAQDESPYVGAADVLAALTVHDQVVLVEFSVPFGCARCDLMRDQIAQLANDQGNRLVYRRVNVSKEPLLASKLRVEMCPSYIAFRDGEELFRTAFPTSADRIAGELERVLSAPADS